MGEQEYPLTLEHVQQFLATKDEEDELGICNNAMYCLLSETLNWLYPKEQPWRVDYYYYYCATQQEAIKLIGPLSFLQRVFDSMHVSSRERVTKAELRKRLSSLDETRDYLAWEWKLPFLLEDLFPSPSVPL